MKNPPSTKDLLYFILLIGLIKVAIIIQEHQPSVVFPSTSHNDLELVSIEKPVLVIHQPSGAIALASPEPAVTTVASTPEVTPPHVRKKTAHIEPFDANEIKENVLKQIDMAQQHIDAITSVVNPT